MNEYRGNQFSISDYDLDQTLSSGQAFVWKKEGEIWYGSTIDGLIVLSQPSPDTLVWQTYPQKDRFELIKKYLRLDFDTRPLVNAIKDDTHAFIAYKRYKGLRLLSQNFYETTISFIISANKNIPSIRKSIQKLSVILGEKVEHNNMLFHLFPKIERIAECSLVDLRSCSLGYRAEYVKQTAQDLLKWSQNEANTDEEVVRKKLVALKGVGNKVADCVLCYSLNFDNVTPLDVWGQRFLANYYNIDPMLSYEKMRNWTKENFYGYAAWVGQYLFEYIRETQGSLKAKR